MRYRWEQEIHEELVSGKGSLRLRLPGPQVYPKGHLPGEGTGTWGEEVQSPYFIPYPKHSPSLQPLSPKGGQGTQVWSGSQSQARGASKKQLLRLWGSFTEEETSGKMRRQSRGFPARQSGQGHSIRTPSGWGQGSSGAGWAEVREEVVGGGEEGLAGVQGL